MLRAGELEDFVTSYWTRKPFISQMAEEDLLTLRTEFFDCDVEEIVRKHSSKVSVWFGSGHSQAVDMAPEDALKFYDEGLTLFLPDVSSPTLEEWSATLSAKLGRINKSRLCSMFVSKKRNTTGCHFDHIENFSVQLHGTKKWRVLRNEHVPLPTVNFNVEARRPYSERMWLYATKPIPATIPESALEIETNPGTVIYMPRGWWHEVEALQDSLSLILAFPAFTWADMVLPALHTLLLRDDRWRANAVCPNSPNFDGWRGAYDDLAELLPQLCKIVAGLEPTLLLPPAPGNGPFSDDQELERNPLSTLGIYRTEKCGELELVATVHQGELSRRRETRVPRHWEAVLRSLDCCVTTTLWGLDQRHTLPLEDLRHLLVVLLELEILRPHGARQLLASRTAS